MMYLSEGILLVNVGYISIISPQIIFISPIFCHKFLSFTINVNPGLINHGS
jgi:hypothetical protein